MLRGGLVSISRENCVGMASQWTCQTLASGDMPDFRILANHMVLQAASDQVTSFSVHQSFSG